MKHLALVFVHSGAREARLFARSVQACRAVMGLYVIGVYGGEATPRLGCEDEVVTIRKWHSLASAWNCGILHALHVGADAVMVANDDTVLSPVAVERLREHLGRGRSCACPCSPEVAALYESFRPFFLPGTTDVYESQRRAYQQGGSLDEALYRWYGQWGGFDRVSEMMAEQNRAQFYEPYFHGLAFMATAGLFEDAGLFDLRFKPAYHEDVDYAKRIIALGARPILAFDSYIHHWGQATSSRMTGWDDVCRRNAAGLEEKERRGFYGLSE